MQGTGYVRPTLPPDVVVNDLSASSSRGPVREPAPDERVLCINRGNKTLVDTFDGIHREIPPGYFEIEYAAAQHHQRRLIVPGTKNIEQGGYVSYIGILGVNDDALCQPFTDEELQQFGEAVEAIDRSALTGSESKVEVIKTSRARAASPTLGAGRGGRRGIDVSAQATPEAEAAAAGVLDPPTESATREAENDAAREAGGRRSRRS